MRICRSGLSSNVRVRTLTTAKGGKCSGTVEIGKSRYSFSGQLDENGTATIPISKAGLTLNLQVGNNQVTGTIGDGATWVATVLANRAGFNAKNEPRAAGRHLHMDHPRLRRPEQHPGSARRQLLHGDGGSVGQAFHEGNVGR